MVRKVLNFIGREIGGLHEAAYLLGFFAILSQILALVRDRLLAFTFGASNTLDMYYAAFRIPDLIFVSIASIVSLSVLIPFLMEQLEKGKEAAKEFIDSVFTIFFFVIGTVSVVVWIFTPELLQTFFPSVTSDMQTFVSMTRIMLLSPILLGFSNFLASITQVYKRFFTYALSPVVYNIGIIIGIVFLYPRMGLTGLAWGVVLGTFLHWFIQVPFVMKKRLFPRITFTAQLKNVQRVMLISIPRTITLSSHEITKFFLVSMASLLAGGAISIFSFAWNLQSVPLSVIGVSYSLAAFPVLTRLYAKGERDKFFAHIVTSTKHIMFWSVPIMVLFIVLRAQIVRVILGAGSFSWTDTRLTAAALALFVVSLVPQSLTLLFVRAHYARGNTKNPLIINIISAVIIIASAFILVRVYVYVPLFKYFIERLLRVEDTPGAIVLMLPLGFSLGAIINMCAHWISFHREYPIYSRVLARPIFQIVSASIIMGYVTYNLLGVFDTVFDINTFLGIFLQGFVSGILGIVVCVGVLMALGSTELMDIGKTLKRRIWRTKVIPPDASI